MPSGRCRIHALIALIFAILGLAEACSASSLTHEGKPHSRRAHPEARFLRHGAKRLTVTLRAEAMLLAKRSESTLDDQVEAPDESEDDLGDEPREALPETGPTLPVLVADDLGALFPAFGTSRPQLGENRRHGGDRPRFLSLCRWLI